jgi:hypothetical protein
MVHLKQPWFPLCINKHVKPQYLKSHTITDVLGLAGLVYMRQTRLRHDHRVSNNLSNARPNLASIKPTVSKLLKRCGQCTLVALCLVIDKTGAVLIDRVVGQVHFHLLQVLGLGCCILYRREAC